MNKITFTKDITNLAWLSESLLDACPQYDYYNKKGNQIDVFFKVPMIQIPQAEIDAVYELINDYVETSIFDLQYKIANQKATEGFDLYKQIIADLNSEGGLGGYIDQQMIPFYLLLGPVRNMLKDGFFEFALRYFVNELVPLNVLSETKANTYEKWIGDTAIKFGSDPQVIEYLKVVPKNQYPFGNVGAP